MGRAEGDKTLDIQIVQRDEIDLVRRFCYSIYVEEMHLCLDKANHTRRVIDDPLDETATIFAAFEEGAIVGTVSFNLAITGLGQFASLFRMEQFGRFYPNRVSMTRRLIVSRKFRNTMLGTRLARTIARCAYDAGSRFDNICCHPRQKRYFDRLGYRQVFPNIYLQGYGDSHALLLVNADRTYLSQVRSPLLSALPEHPDDYGSVRFFYENLICTDSLLAKRSCEATPGVFGAAGEN